MWMRSAFDSWADPIDWNCHHLLKTSDSSGYWAPVLSQSIKTVGDTINCPPFSVAWKESDLSLLPPIEDVSTTTSGPDTSLSASPAPTATQTHEFGSNSRLSVGAAAGIGIGVALGIICLLVTSLWFLKRYKRCASSREGYTLGGINTRRELQSENQTETSMLAKKTSEGLQASHSSKTNGNDDTVPSELG